MDPFPSPLIHSKTSFSASGYIGVRKTTKICYSYENRRILNEKW